MCASIHLNKFNLAAVYVDFPFSLDGIQTIFCKQFIEPAVHEQ